MRSQPASLGRCCSRYWRSALQCGSPVWLSSVALQCGSPVCLGVPGGLGRARSLRRLPRPRRAVNVPSVSPAPHGHTVMRSKLTVPRIERPRPGTMIMAAAAGRTGAPDHLGPVREPALHRPPNGPPAQLAGSHGAQVTAGPRQLGTKAAGQAGSPRRVALVEPHAAST
eukprot:COSAG06_NODE_3121_length_5823_cov_2.794899_1_plen_168_part_10